MLTVLVLLGLLVLVVAFMIYDRVSPKPKFDRKAMASGVVPGATPAWIALAILSGTMFVVGASDLLVHSESPRETGRGEQFVAILEAIFGKGAFGYSCLAFGALLAFMAYRQWRSRSTRS
jgi:hypothetical protein